MLYNNGNSSTPSGQTEVWVNATKSWTETGITWNNQPTNTTNITSFVDPTSLNAWVKPDVTSSVAGDGTYSFELISSSPSRLDYASQEDGTSSHRPVLEIIYAP